MFGDINGDTGGGDESTYHDGSHKPAREGSHRESIVQCARGIDLVAVGGVHENLGDPSGENDGGDEGVITFQTAAD